MLIEMTVLITSTYSNFGRVIRKTEQISVARDRLSSLSFIYIYLLVHVCYCVRCVLLFVFRFLNLTLRVFNSLDVG